MVEKAAELVSQSVSVLELNIVRGVTWRHFEISILVALYYNPSF